LSLRRTKDFYGTARRYKRFLRNDKAIQKIPAE
jgi:hypothetical protein